MTNIDNITTLLARDENNKLYPIRQFDAPKEIKPIKVPEYGNCSECDEELLADEIKLGLCSDCEE